MTLYTQVEEKCILRRPRGRIDDCSFIPNLTVLNDSACGNITAREFGRRIVNSADKEKILKMALRVFGVIFLLIYPLAIVWPSGWVWHGGGGVYYYQMIVGIYAVLGIFLIIAANNPSAHRSLISFTIWSSVVHAIIMAVQALGDENETGHLVGDVPALLLVAAVLWYFSPSKSSTR